MKARMARESLLVPTVEFFASDLAMGNLLHKVLEINVIYLRMIGSCQLIFEIGCHFGCSIFFNDRHQVYGPVNCSSTFHPSISATHSTTSKSVRNSPNKICHCCGHWHPSACSLLAGLKRSRRMDGKARNYQVVDIGVLLRWAEVGVRVGIVGVV
jgi:hypothetical protein